MYIIIKSQDLSSIIILHDELEYYYNIHIIVERVIIIEIVYMYIVQNVERVIFVII